MHLKQRGRKTEKNQPDQRFNVIEGNFAGQQRPEPPDDLTERQKEIWRIITRDEPIDKFSTGELQLLLKSLCQSRDTLEKVNKVINDFEDVWLRNGEGAKRFQQYLKARALEVRNCSALSTKLRLTNQSRYTPQAAATASNNTLKGARPWEWDPPA